uniref:Dachshund family transcription factor 2 n=1 Tax=Chelonoidis abingdonii TaxID=106734 RepID=A0A8C0HDG2_CHEAB
MSQHRFLPYCCFWLLSSWHKCLVREKECSIFIYLVIYLHLLGLTAAAMAEAMKLQKMKLMAMNSLHGSGSQNGTESENEELNSNAGGSESSWDKEKLQSPITTGSQHGVGHATLSGQSSLGSAHPLSPLQQNHLLTNRIDLPFMMMPHPLLPVSLPPASVAMAMNQMNHLNTIANMAAAAQMHSPLSRAGASVIKERIQDSPSPAPSLEDSQRPGSHASSHQSSSVSSSPSQLDNTPDRIEVVQIAIPIMKPTLDKVQLAGQTLPPGFPAPFLFADGLSSVETLLTNIQGLLKVAVDNARVQEKQIQQEKKELKMELCRERELRESLERQLTAELQSRATIQKRLKKEKKAKRKLQEALEFESKRREQVEQALKQATSGDGLRMLNEAGIPDMEIEHNGTQHDSAAMQGAVYFTLSANIAKPKCQNYYKE